MDFPYSRWVDFGFSIIQSTRIKFYVVPSEKVIGFSILPLGTSYLIKLIKTVLSRCFQCSLQIVFFAVLTNIFSGYCTCSCSRVQAFTQFSSYSSLIFTFNCCYFLLFVLIVTVFSTQLFQGWYYFRLAFTLPDLWPNVTA